MPAGRRGRAAAPEKENRERWLLTYADLITLLLAFFVIMYALSNADVRKFLLLRGSLQQAFNVGVLQGETVASIVSSGEFSVEGEVPSITEPQASQVQSQVQLLQDQDTLFKDVIQFVGQRPEGLVVSLSGTLAFLSGSADLTPEGVAALTELAEILRPVDNDLRIEGHTDSIPPGSARFPTNWELGAARAVTIVRFLEREGIAPYRLSAFGYGEYRPIAGNESPRDRALNRRADIVILDPTANLSGGSGRTGAGGRFI